MTNAHHSLLQTTTACHDPKQAQPPTKMTATHHQDTGDDDGHERPCAPSANNHPQPTNTYQSHERLAKASHERRLLTTTPNGPDRPQDDSSAPSGPTNKDRCSQTLTLTPPPPRSIDNSHHHHPHTSTHAHHHRPQCMQAHQCNRLLSYPIIAARISKINNEPAWS